MAKVGIIFASMTGNTEQMAKLIAKGVEESGVEVTVQDVTKAEPAQLTDFDGVLLGSYTYGAGDLADEFVDYYDALADVSLSGKAAATFGSGDTSYPDFCAAVDMLADKLKEAGAVIVQDGLKIELDPEDEEAVIDFGRQFAEKVK